jgi:hypothetical protein
MEIPMWKTLIAGTTILTIAGSTLASAQQPAPAERPHHSQLTADDIAAFTDARIAALKTALRLTPDQEKNWPAVEQALREISKERVARRVAPPRRGIFSRSPGLSVGKDPDVCGSRHRAPPTISLAIRR